MGKQKDDRLTPMQEAFVSHYLILGNGTAAARKAGYSGEDNGLAVTASENLRNPKIVRALRARMDNTLVMQADEVLLHLTDIGRGDVGDVTVNGNIDIAEAIRRGKSHLIKRLKTKTTVIDGGKDGGDREIHETEIEMYSRQEALNQLGRFYALFIDKTDITSGGEKLPTPQIYLPGVIPDHDDSEPG